MEHLITQWVWLLKLSMRHKLWRFLSAWHSRDDTLVLDGMSAQYHRIFVFGLVPQCVECVA